MKETAIFSVGDARYIPVAFVALNSIKRFNPGYDYFVFVPTDSPGTAKWRKYEDQLGIRIVELEFGSYFRSQGARPKWPLECLLWFIVPALLRTLGYSHSLYVDGDTLCLKSLDFGELIDRRESILGVANGTVFNQLAQLQRIEQTIGRKLVTANIATNSGVLFFRHDDLAESLFTQRAVRLYEQCWPWGLREPGDQSLLALYFAAHDVRLGILDPSWNLRLYPDGYGHNYRRLRGYYEQTHTPNIVHFVGGKPWTDPPTARSLYQYYVGKTSGELWNGIAPTKVESANQWRRMAVETLGAEDAVRVFGPRVQRAVRTPIAGAVHGRLMEMALNRRARKAIPSRVDAP